MTARTFVPSAVHLKDVLIVVDSSYEGAVTGALQGGGLQDCIQTTGPPLDAAVPAEP